MRIVGNPKKNWDSLLQIQTEGRDDSRADRYITGRWINLVSHGHYFHRELQEEKADPDGAYFSEHPERF